MYPATRLRAWDKTPGVFLRCPLTCAGAMFHFVWAGETSLVPRRRNVCMDGSGVLAAPYFRGEVHPSPLYVD